MRGTEEIKKWVDSLSKGEKRYVQLIGKALAGQAGSQQLELLDWLCTCKPGDSPPADAAFQRNLPMVTMRLKALILDSLCMLHKDRDVDAQLSAANDTLAQLSDKALLEPAFRAQRKAFRLALDYSRYDSALQFLEWERRLLHQQAGPGKAERLQQLRETQVQLMKRLARLQDLRHRLDMVQARQIFVPRDPAVLEEVRAHCAPDWIEALSQTGPSLEQAIAVQLLGIRDLIERHPWPSISRYEQFLQQWQAHPDWQRDQAPLLLQICKNFQSACFYSRMSFAEAQRRLAAIPDFHTLAPDIARDYQRMLFHHHYLCALNQGNFEAINTLIPEIDRWLHTHAKALTPAQVLTFLHNFAVAEFLQGRYAAAYQQTVRIQNMPGAKARTDIRSFAVVLQAVLQYELGDESLAESLLRAGKRHFRNKASTMKFELVVFRHLQFASRTDDAAKLAASIAELADDLDQLTSPLPNMLSVLGLMELRIWATAKRHGQPIRDVFLDILAQNLAYLE